MITSENLGLSELLHFSYFNFTFRWIFFKSVYIGIFKHKGTKLQRNKADQPQHEIMGKCSGSSIKNGGDDLRVAVGSRARKEHFESQT